jgi:hypothetical protein
MTHSHFEWYSKRPMRDDGVSLVGDSSAPEIVIRGEVVIVDVVEGLL